MNVSRVRLAAGLAAGALLMSACAAHHEGTSTDETPRIVVGRSVDLDLGRDVGPPAVGAGRLVFSAATQRGGNLNSVTSVDLATHRRSVVARTAFPHGFINFATASGDWTVFGDQSRIQKDGVEDVLWRVVAVNSSTHARRLLASNGHKADPFVPTVKSQGGYVFWAAAESDRTARQMVWRPEWPTARTIQRHVQADSWSSRIDGTWLVYLGPPAAARTSAADRADCWRVRLTGGAPEPLTRSGLAVDCLAGADQVVWAEHSDPATDDPAEGSANNPYRYLVRTGGRAAIAVHEGYTASAYGAIIGRFVAWVDLGEHAVLTSIDDPVATLQLPGITSGDPFLVDGSTVVIMTSKGSRQIAQVYDLNTIHLAPPSP